MKSRKLELINNLELLPHPEGGYFKENYRSSEKVDLSESEQSFSGPRSFSTAIYYLLGADDFSAFHRIKSDELWHFYEGNPIVIHIIHQDGLYEAKYLGKDTAAEQEYQVVVPAGAWFAAEVLSRGENKDAFSLAGCTVSPGFDFDDFELADSYMLCNAFPEHHEIIRRLVR
ncbi:MAG: cupin domain-containing protein [Balneolales bacterium]|nr:cupin domain-containing protein [Balneolales bacterium]